MTTKKGLIERMNESVVIGDGGFVFALEKRGYVKAGPWTPEATCENPEAVRQLHREFLRAGSDVMQAFTFYASDDKLTNRGHTTSGYTCADINKAACALAKEVAAEGNALVLGGISETPTYLSGEGKEAVQEQLRKQINVFVEEKMDFLLCEYFEYIEEMEWAIEVCKETNLPVVATMCIGPWGDMHKVPVGECAVRMAKAGADVVGVNCHFDPFVSLETMELMKEALHSAQINVHMAVQPLGYLTPDAERQGFIDLPEFPFGLESRVCSRWDFHKFARQAYDMGIRYIGGCCGVEPYHIRAVAEELAGERKKFPEASLKHDMWGKGLKIHTKPWVRARANKEYWYNLNPASGRPYAPCLSRPDKWGVTKGSEMFKQHKEETTDYELEQVKKFSQDKTPASYTRRVIR